MEPETTPEEHRQRALLLADLGRYDEAAGEIAAGLSAAPDEAGLLATLARVHLAAEQPAEALAAANRAVTAAPDTVAPLVVRAMALTDNRRYAEAADVATGILRAWPDDAYAQRTGAALLSESRNGQEALNAAWSGVRAAPADGEAHLVLAVVAARLRLFDLAQRAYAEALELDPAIGDAGRELGIVRFERRRWARAIEELADEASLAPPVAAEAGAAQPDVFAVSRPAGPVLDTSGEVTASIRRFVQYFAGTTVVVTVLTAAMTLISMGISRMWATLVAIFLYSGIAYWLRREVGGRGVLRRLRVTAPRLATAAWLTIVAPGLLVLYTVVGSVWPLVTGLALALLAELLFYLERD